MEKSIAVHGEQEEQYNDPVIGDYRPPIEGIDSYAFEKFPRKKDSCSAGRILSQVATLEEIATNQPTER